MGFLAGFLKVVTVVPACVEAVDSVVNGIQKIRANAPRAKLEALKKCRAESEQLHEKAKSEINRMHEEAQKCAQEDEEAAERRIKKQKEENDEALEELRKKIEQGAEKHEKNMRDMEEKHKQKMKELRTETSEIREKAEKEHKEKMNTLDKEQKQEKKEAQEKLEKVKLEGERKIKEAEKEKNEVTKQREEALALYNQEMEKLMNSNHEHVLAIQRESDRMRKENCQLKIEQLKEKDQLTTEHLNQITQDMARHFNLQSNKELIGKFQSIIEPVYKTRNSLEAICLECSNPDEPVLPGVLEPDFAAIGTERAKYQTRVNSYRQFVINTPRAHPEILKACSAFITRMDKTMETRELLALTKQLPKAIESDNHTAIRDFCKVAENLEKEIRNIRDDLNKQYDSWVVRHLNDSSNGQNQQRLEN